MVEHKQLPVELDDYELEEVPGPVGELPGPATIIRLTIHGKNFFIGGLEPVVRIGDVVVQNADVALDQRKLIGWVTEAPKEGAAITLEYGGRTVGWLREPFTMRKLKRR